MQAYEASKAKSAFFATINHDMRTPLNGVLGYTDLALEAEDTGVIRNYLSKIKTSGQLLLELINDFLDFGKYAHHQIKLKPEPMKIEDLCTSVETIIRPLALRKDITFHVECSSPYAGYVEADSLRIQQIFVNLLSNAVKFTKPGGYVENIITVTERSHDVHCQIIVRDTGIGMSRDFLPKVFDAYSQERRATAESPGTGLGMAIVKQVVDLMGGRIAVESEIDVGTTYTVSLPLQKAAVPEAPAPIQVGERSWEALQGTCVLLCEDNALNAEIAQLILQKWGMIVDWAENGKQAVDLIKVEHRIYDLILMDKRMPVMDGLEAVRAIRRHEAGTGHHMPVIALTGDVDETSIQDCLEAGMDRHVNKPIDRDELLRVIQSVLA